MELEHAKEKILILYVIYPFILTEKSKPLNGLLAGLNGCADAALHEWVTLLLLEPVPALQNTPRTKMDRQAEIPVAA